MTLQTDSMLKNRYRIERVIAKGGMGAIYAAFDESLSVHVAVKENLITNEDATKQFRREASILASLRHSNLPRVTDHFVIPDQGQYLVMDFIEGEDLKDRISRTGSISEEETILIGIAISNALAYMHSRKPSIVHRDIKPGNIKITPTGEVYLVDFGIAKISQPDHGTTVGAQSLTPGFAPPEQYGQGTDPRSDIYSLGATLYMAITGLVPASGLARLMNQQELTPIRQIKPSVTQECASVIEKSLQVQKDDRYQTADEMMNDLTNLHQSISLKNNAVRTITIDPSPTVTSTHQFDHSIQQNKPEADHSIPPVPVRKSFFSRSRILLGGGILLFLCITAVIAVFALNLLPGIYVAQNNTPSVTFTLLSPSFTSTLIMPSATIEQSTFAASTPTITIENEVSVNPPTIEPTIDISPTPNSTPQGGGSGQILFVSDRTGSPQLFIMNVDGSVVMQITNESDGACQPDWSPDGNRIVFVSPCKVQKIIDPQDEVYRGSTLFIINSDGTSRMPIASFPGGDFDPAWSPDGTRILFTSYRDNLTSADLNLYSYDVASNTAVVITKDLNSDRHPAWSPDGQNIAFQRMAQGGSPQINIMAQDGSGIYIFTDQEQKNSFMPDWNIDGSVLFSRGDPFPVPYARPLSPRNAQEIRLSDENAWDMDFSKDGYWVVFERVTFFSDNTRNYDIFLMSSIGGSAIQLTDDPARDYQPVWKP